MKKILQYLLDKTLIPIICSVSKRVVAEVSPKKVYTVLDALQQKAAEESADYVRQHLPNAVIFAHRFDLLSFAIEKVAIDGLFAEFGVYIARSINHIASRTNKVVYGFDSFEGLHEDWKGGPGARKTFDLGGKLPDTKSNVQFVKGWFHETLPQFLREHPEPFAFIHIDCDTFEAVNTVLKLIDKRIVPGTIIAFDEYFGYSGWRQGEYKAWNNFTRTTVVKYEYLGFCEYQVAVKIIEKSA